MRTALRLGLYGLALLAVFTTAAFTANALVSEDTVRAWVEEEPDQQHDDAANHQENSEH